MFYYVFHINVAFARYNEDRLSISTEKRGLNDFLQIWYIFKSRLKT